MNKETNKNLTKLANNTKKKEKKVADYITQKKQQKYLNISIVKSLLVTMAQNNRQCMSNCNA
jgi:hypothetical protein